MFSGRGNGSSVGMVAPQPGQYIHGKTGGPGELGRILQKAFALFTVRMMTFGAWAWIALVFGPTLTGVTLLAIGGYWLYVASQEAEYPPHWALIIGLEVAIAALAGAWIISLADQFAVLWWPSLFGLRVDAASWYWRLAFVATAIAWLSVQRHVVFRLQYEVSDSNYPGPIGMREGWQGPVGPDTEFIAPQVAEVAMPEPSTRVVSRPIPVYQNGTLVSDTHGGTGGDSQFAPSGREVPNAVLRQFVRGSYRRGTAFVNVWKPRGWEYSKWKDTVELLHIFGVTSELQERTKTRLLLETQEDALARLEQYLN